MGQTRLPTVTVGIPFYWKSDPGAFGIAIDSILKQTYPIVEIHLIQDGPIPDALSNVIIHYTSLSNHINHIVVNKNSGLAYCLNLSILLCRTQLYARMDADDYSVPDRIERQVRYLDANPDVEILGTFAKEYCRHPNEPDAQLKTVPERMTDIRNTFHYRAPMIHASVIFRHEVFARIGLYNVHYRADEDNDLWLRAIRAKVGMANLPEPLYYIGISDQVSRRATIRAVAEAAWNKLRLFTWSPRLNFLKCAFITYRLLPTNVQSIIYKKSGIGRIKSSNIIS